MERFEQFYKINGIRIIDQLINPRIIILKELPRDSIIHYPTYDFDDDIFETPHTSFLTKHQGNIILEFIDKDEVGYSFIGSKTNAPLPNSVISNIRKQDKRIVIKKAGEETKVPATTPIYINYDQLKNRYRIQNNDLKLYHQLIFIQDNVLMQAVKLSETTQKNNFIFLDAFTSVLTPSLCQYLSKSNDGIRRRILNTPEKLINFRLYNFIMGIDDPIKIPYQNKEELFKINFVFTTKTGHSAILNLAYLHTWIRGNEQLVKNTNRSQYRNVDIFKALTGFLMVLQSRVPEELSDSEEEVSDEEQQEDEDDDNLDDDELLSDLIKAETLEADPLVKQREKTSASFSDIDQQIKLLEFQEKEILANAGITTNDDNAANKNNVQLKSEAELVDIIFKPKDPQSNLMTQLNDRLSKGYISAPEYKKLQKTAAHYQNSKNPYGGETTVNDLIQYDPKDIALTSDKTTLNEFSTTFSKDMIHSTINPWGDEYVKKHFKRDVIKVIAGLQNGGVIVKNHEIETEHTILGDTETHHLELHPIDGVSSSIHFQIPIINEDRTYMVGGNKYYFRPQKVELPIRKTGPNEVTLNTYYGKTFITTESKIANNESNWILKAINKASIEANDWIMDVVPGNVFDSRKKQPRVLGYLSENFISFKAGNINFVFNDSSTYVKDKIKEIDGDKYLCGYSIDSTQKLLYLYCDINEQFYIYNGKTYNEIGKIYQLLNLNIKDAPVRFSDVRIFKKDIPVCLVLGYRLGFNNLLTLLKVNPKIISTEEVKYPRYEDHEYAISFRDKHYIFSRNDALPSMILGGFLQFSKLLKIYDSSDFDNKDVYLNILTSKNLGIIYLREMGMMFDYFVDPITKEVLIEMNEPITFEGLLIRSSELLLTYHHPKLQDSNLTRIRGYERIPGMIYKELITSIRTQRNRNITGRAKIEMGPWKVSQAISEDQTKMMVQEINPVQDLKNAESVTLVGEGGRSKDAINKKSRAYTAEDMGFISEATVDSSDVGVNNYLSANPKILNLRGMRDLNETEITPTQLLSSAALTSPFSMNDDMKRVVFISIQHGHTISAEGYHAPIIRTGYENIVAQRTTATFAYCAKQNGKVIQKNNQGIVIEYVDGTKTGIELGRIFGRSEGSIYPYSIESLLNVGDAFKKGDPICYNTSFFQPDHYDKNSLVMKNSLSAKVVLIEDKNTHEDSSAISKELSDRLMTKTTYLRNFIIDFDQHIHNVVEKGKLVEPDDILLIIEDKITTDVAKFDTKAIDALKQLANNAPKSNYRGVVEKIEVYYHGDVDSMSESLKKLTLDSDKEISKIAASTNKPKTTGLVNTDYRVDGKALGVNKAEVKFYITINTSMGVADKVIFANQMKSVNSEVMDYEMFTESGEKIDAKFGPRSIAARNVNSPYLIGTTMLVLELIEKEAISLHKNLRVKS